MGIRATSKIAGSPNKYIKKVGNVDGGWQEKRVGNGEQGAGLA
jgi:hypothetical protein